MSVLEAKEAIDQVARYRRSSRGTALFQCLQEMHRKQAIVPDWDRNVLELALKRSFLSLWGMLPRTVQSIFTDDSFQKLSQGIYCCRQVRQEPVVVIDLSQKRSHFSYIV